MWTGIEDVFSPLSFTHCTFMYSHVWRRKKKKKWVEIWVLCLKIVCVCVCLHMQAPQRVQERNQYATIHHLHSWRFPSRTRANPISFNGRVLRTADFISIHTLPSLAPPLFHFAVPQSPFLSSFLSQPSSPHTSPPSSLNLPSFHFTVELILSFTVMGVVAQRSAAHWTNKPSAVSACKCRSAFVFHFCWACICTKRS